MSALFPPYQVPAAARSFFPSGQAPAPPAPGATPPQPLQFGPDGRIVGLDGVLDQIAEAIGRQVAPLVRDTALPIIQRDRELQRTLGEAAGRGAVKELKPFLWIAAGALGVIAVTYVVKATRPPPEPCYLPGPAAQHQGAP